MDRQNKQNLTVQLQTIWGKPRQKFLTIEDVADILQVSIRTVYNLIYKGTLRACRLTYHTTIITWEDFGLMLEQATYHRRSASIFAKQKKKKMNKDTDNDIKAPSLPETRGKGKTKSGTGRQQLLPPEHYKQSVRGTFTKRESAGDDLYTMAEICQKYHYTYGRFYNLRMRYSIPCVKARSTKCFPKAEVDKAMAQEAARLGNDLSEHWYSCSDLMRLFGLGKTQVRRFALTHGVRTKLIHGNRLYYLKEDWDEARRKAELKSTSTKVRRKG